MMPHWDNLDMRGTISPSLGIYTSLSGSAPNRIFNIEWRACLFNGGTCGGEVNFEVRLYEGPFLGDSRFDFVYGNVAGGGAGATVGVQSSFSTSRTQFSCNTTGLVHGLLLNFQEPDCANNPFTTTPSRTATFTSTPTPTNTPTPAPAAVLTGHVAWQGPPPQPDPLQQLPISLTLRMLEGGPDKEYPGLTTDPAGYFTVPVESLAGGSYAWRVKGPKYLANSGVLTLSGASTSVEMGLLKAGDANGDNLVNVSDFGILSPSFGRSSGQPGYDGRADFTGDLAVTIADFGLLKLNFGMAGAPPAGPPGTSGRKDAGR
jgi:hypothetical protein